MAAATSSSDQIGLQRAVVGGGETSDRRGGRDGTAAAARRATPDGPPTDSEHAECLESKIPLTVLQCTQTYGLFVLLEPLLSS